MPAGNSSASNMESLQMDKCTNNHKMIHSEPSSHKHQQESMYPDPSSSIFNLQSSIKSEQGHTDNYIIPHRWSLPKKMQPITSQEDTIPLESKLLTSLLIESEKWLIIVQDSKVSSSTTRLEEARDQVSDHYSCKDCQSIMEKNPK